MTSNDSRVDVTFVGYLLIGFVLLLFGMYGLQSGDVFGETYKDMPIDRMVFGQINMVVGLILILLTIFAYRTGNKTSAGAFAFFGMFFVFNSIRMLARYNTEVVTNSMWFLYIAVAIFALIFAIYEAFNKAPKFVAVFLLLFALTVFFMGLSCVYSVRGPCTNADLYDATVIVYGIFALLGFVVATYLGIAYADPKKIPLI